MLHRFEVALWRSWPSLMPEYVAVVDASTAFEAVEYLMHCLLLPSVAYASAWALDGSLVYRAVGVRLGMEEVSEEEGASV